MKTNRHSFSLRNRAFDGYFYPLVTSIMFGSLCFHGPATK